MTIIDKTNHELKRWGCPVHYELLTSTVFDIQNPWYNPPSPKQVAQVNHALCKLVNKGVIRRVRRGVYSAYGNERD